MPNIKGVGRRRSIRHNHNTFGDSDYYEQKFNAEIEKKRIRLDSSLNPQKEIDATENEIMDILLKENRDFYQEKYDNTINSFQYHRGRTLGYKIKKFFSYSVPAFFNRSKETEYLKRFNENERVLAISKTREKLNETINNDIVTSSEYDESLKNDSAYSLIGTTQFEGYLLEHKSEVFKDAKLCEQMIKLLIDVSPYLQRCIDSDKRKRELKEVFDGKVKYLEELNNNSFNNNSSKSIQQFLTHKQMIELMCLM